MTTYSADQWRTAYKNLRDSTWEDEDAQGDLEATLLQVYRHDQDGHNEYMVLATIEACVKLWDEWEPSDIIAMAETFSGYYDSQDDALDEHLQEHYNGFPLKDVAENASVRGEVFSKSDLVVELHFGGVYVFREPGSPIDQLLNRARLLTDPPPAPVEYVPE